MHRQLFRPYALHLGYGSDGVGNSPVADKAHASHCSGFVSDRDQLPFESTGKDRNQVPLVYEKGWQASCLHQDEPHLRIGLDYPNQMWRNQASIKYLLFRNIPPA